ncbi:MAG: purine-nucleoside phosphorylase [Candidatus Harrisonbacteria bacterium]|nr:purine-nucleoside phosphorylase [Candidatus Harrisonbacteria bacterium]MBI2406321.1 purine-nucleoside phosphorylase [Candidatus Harrisonbacteria bacterium]MBI2604326.1 purine-nucleoside phosphorylase [Candidatus Harrisonbacteria bacterium]
MGYINPDCDREAKEAAQSLVEHLFLDPQNLPRIAVVLGTGWGDALEFEQRRSAPLTRITEYFWSLGDLAGHAREVVAGRVAGMDIIALRGRVHVNEKPASDPNIQRMVRLQVAMFFALGVKTIILTNAAGTLRPEVAHVGDIVAADGFVVSFAPDLPGWAGEFASPEDTLDSELRFIARAVGNEVGLVVHNGGYAMLRGPFFEGRKYDKPLLRASGAIAVGMSTLPEACAAALYDARVLALSFITNDNAEEHSHEENMRRAKKQSGNLSALLRGIIQTVGVSTSRKVVEGA